MKNIILLASILIAYMPISNANEEVVIIVHSDMAKNEYSKYILKKLFLGRYTVNEAGQVVSPCYLNIPNVKNSLYSLTNKTSAKYRSYWNKKLFSGSGSPPKSFKNLKNLYKYMSDNESGVCLITKSSGIPKEFSIVSIKNNK